jgi:hypothetical protein
MNSPEKVEDNDDDDDDDDDERRDGVELRSL